MSAPDPYGPGAAAGHHAPPGQGYDPSYPPPGNGYNDQQYQGYNGPQSPPPQHASYDPHSGYPIPPGFVPPQKPPASSYDPNNFAPPPREEYRDDYSQAPPPSEYNRGYDRAPPSEYGPRSEYNDRPYAPTEPAGHEGNAMTPYDEDKAEAEWQRGYEEHRQKRRQSQPGPPLDYDRRDRRSDDQYDERDLRNDDRYYDYRPSNRDRNRRSLSDDRSSYYDRDRRYDDRRRSKPQSPKTGGKDFFGGKEGERGLGAQILGGAVGGLAGHEFGKGNILETLGGVVVGAVGAKVLENQHEKRKTKKESDVKGSAPHKDEAVYGSGRYASTYGGSRVPTRDDRKDYGRSRDTRSTRRGDSRRRGSESDSYSSDDYDSRPPPRRSTMR